MRIYLRVELIGGQPPNPRQKISYNPNFLQGSVVGYMGKLKDIVLLSQC